MILTPEQIEQCAVVEIDKTVMLSQYAHVCSTLLAYADIVQNVAEDEPWISGIGDMNPDGSTEQTMACVYCDGGYQSTNAIYDHEPDCLYLAARKLRGLELGE